MAIDSAHTAARSQPNETPAPCTATRTAILDAAEELFGENGVDGTSVRDIARKSGANLGAINYYFGSKDRLAIEVFVRALEPANKRRLAWLGRLEEEADGKPLKIETIMEVLIRPMIERGTEDIHKSDALHQLMARCFHESNPEVNTFVKERFANVCQRFDTAINRALPELPLDEIFWRMQFVIGAMHHAVGVWLRFDFLPLPTLPHNEKPRRLDVEELIQQLIVCATAAFRAPSPKNLS